MKMIVGLGNMGKEYEKTRHNIGFEVIDAYAKSKAIELTKKEHHGLSGSFFYQGEKILLVKPTTFMNNSGLCLTSLVNYYDLSLAEIVVICDDIDLPLGNVRIRKKGGAGTHNGMRSIIQGLGSGDFPRIRMGIGSPGSSGNLIHFVLGKFSKKDWDPMEEAIKEAIKGLDLFLEQGIDKAMNRVNVRKKMSE